MAVLHNAGPAQVKENGERMFLEIKDIYKRFQQTEVLKGVSFAMEQGQVLSLIGSSGSGKTTLLRCLNFLETPDEGEIFLNGELLFRGSDKNEMTEIQLREKRLHFGLVFQQFNLFPQYTALRNITLAPELLHSSLTPQAKAEIEENGRALLQRVGLGDRTEAYPHQLSGGQQQRVAIARALALKPNILCFDEPTSALDPELTGEVLEVIKSLKSKDSTMIIVTHEMQFAEKVSDTVIFMADGVVEEMGTPSDIFGNPQKAKTRAFLQKEEL